MTARAALNDQSAAIPNPVQPVDRTAGSGMSRPRFTTGQRHPNRGTGWNLKGNFLSYYADACRMLLATTNLTTPGVILHKCDWGTRRRENEWEATRAGDHRSADCPRGLR